MKKILLALLTLSAIYSYGQDTLNNFSKNEMSITWIKKYSCNKGFGELFLLLKTSGEFLSIDTAGNKMFGDLRQFDADYKGAGFARMNTSIYISSGHINGFAVLSLKDTIFTVEIKKIVFEQAYSAGTPGSLFSLEKGEKTPIETYAINKKKNVFKNNFTDDSKIIDYSFNKKFQPLLK